MAKDTGIGFALDDGKAVLVNPCRTMEHQPMTVPEQSPSEGRVSPGLRPPGGIEASFPTAAVAPTAPTDADYFDWSKFFTSKTNIVGLLTLAIGIIALVTQSNLIPPHWVAILTIVSGSLTIVIRTFLTYQPIAPSAKRAATATTRSAGAQNASRAPDILEDLP